MAHIKASVFIATSLDGFIARNDGRLDWLDAFNATCPKGEDCGYQTFSASVDVIVMGRHSYEFVAGFETWPYGDKRVVVLSTQPLEIPARLQQTVSASSEGPEALLERLSGEGLTHAYIDGGVTVQRFLQAGLIDEMTITVIPVLIGSGKRLFGDLPHDLALTLTGSKAYEFGCVQSKYRIAGR